MSSKLKKIFNKFISTKKSSAGKGSRYRIFAGIPLLIRNRIPPLWMFLPILKGSQKPFGKLTFWETFVNFFSKIMRRSTLLYTYFTRDSNLFFVKLMSRCAKIRLFNLLLQSDFKWLGLVYNLLLLDFAIYIYICICSMLCNFYPVCLLIFYQSCNQLSWWKTKKTSFLTRCCNSHPTLPFQE